MNVTKCITLDIDVAQQLEDEDEKQGGKKQSEIIEKALIEYFKKRKEK